MIKANELRLGNWVEWQGRPQKIISIEARQFICMVEEGRETYYHIFSLPHLETTAIHYNPIELSPEILEKAGFEHRKHLNDWFIEVSDNSILIVRDWATMICASNQQPCIFGEMKYLHQLQNLFFALTGEELEIIL